MREWANSYVWDWKTYPRIPTFPHSSIPTFHNRAPSLILRVRVVGEAVHPALAWLRRREYSVFLLHRMAPRMPIRGRIAAERPTARLTRSKVDPVLADLHAFFAGASTDLDLCDGAEMRATLHGHAHFSRATRSHLPSVAPAS